MMEKKRQFNFKINHTKNDIYQTSFQLVIGEKAIFFDCSIISNEYLNGQSTYLKKQLDKFSDSELYEILIDFYKEENDENLFMNEMNNRKFIEGILILSITKESLINNQKKQLEKMKKE
ncbi:hypothetical protein [Commensalibacter melissae]|uniref:hypothetical protein n=1 Tax=Commensalibacter melissae TaxID=2070537 RepID=UPI0012D8CAD2|nr:hypothetical protein [Commensalibacter melissae]MUH05803.1 hypothetical protein [Commensalibacter melissae]